jgi:hypothetical protein
VNRALAVLLWSASLCACQALSGLNQLSVASQDAGAPNADGCAADGCDAPLACDFSSQTPCAADEHCAHFSEEPAGDFCVVPATSCATDGRCDEPEWGTRRCASGSDAADCACTPAVDGASCDLVTQCGCSPGSHCALLEVHDARASLGCTPELTPLRKPGAACNAESECPAGYSCWRGLCEKYCTTDGDCPSGQCVTLRDGAEIAGLRVCSVACDFESDSGCQSGTRCVRAPQAAAYCLVPRAPCPFVDDGVCDEPQGSRICVKGSDILDCS